MNVTEIIRYHKYPVNEHDVITEDGYILSVQQIPYGKRNINMTSKRKPVLILHGIFEGSGAYVANTPDKNLAYFLAEKGFDVWLGNFRGNNLGRRHKTLSPRSNKFWQFSLDEMVKYDLPAMINFVLSHTGFRQLHYIGHSMGTTTVFALLSSSTEFDSKIRSVHAMGPTAEISNAKSPMFAVPKMFNRKFIRLMEFIGGYEFLPNSPFFEYLKNLVCLPKVTSSMCSYPLFLIMGYDAEQFNDTRIGVYTHFLPVGTSTRTYHHILQMSRSNRFQAYDFGPALNRKKYNQSIPTLYDMTKIKVPVALYWGEGDTIAVPEDVAIIKSRLKNCLVLDYSVPFKQFNHMDFLWALKVVPLVYDKMVETMNRLW